MTENNLQNDVADEIETTETSEPESTETTAELDSQPDETLEGKAGREAAKYRRQLRDAEGERDTLRGQLDQARAQIITAAMGKGRGVTVEALTAAGHDVADLFDADGHLDRDALDTAVTATAAKFGITPARLHLPSEGKIPSSSRDTANFAAAFAPPTR